MKNALFVWAVFSIFFCASIAYAHPPSDIQISYDSSTRVLHAVIVHEVSNPSSHYIKKVDVSLNGKEIIEQTISGQDNNKSQEVTYLVPNVNIGDMLSVEGYCSLSGVLKKDILPEK